MDGPREAAQQHLSRSHARVHTHTPKRKKFHTHSHAFPTVPVIASHHEPCWGGAGGGRRPLCCETAGEGRSLHAARPPRVRPDGPLSPGGARVSLSADGARSSAPAAPASHAAAALRFAPWRPASRHVLSCDECSRIIVVLIRAPAILPRGSRLGHSHPRQRFRALPMPRRRRLRPGLTTATAAAAAEQQQQQQQQRQNGATASAAAPAASSGAPASVAEPAAPAARCRATRRRLHRRGR